MNDPYYTHIRTDVRSLSNNVDKSSKDTESFYLQLYPKTYEDLYNFSNTLISFISNGTLVFDYLRRYK